MKPPEVMTLSSSAWATALRVRQATQSAASCLNNVFIIGTLDHIAGCRRAEMLRYSTSVAQSAQTAAKVIQYAGAALSPVR